MEEGKRLLQSMWNSGMSPTTRNYNSVLFAMAKHATREAHSSQQLFGEMKSSGVPPDVTTYNTLMKIKSKNGDVDGCFALFEEIKENDLEPDVHSYNILMNIKGRQRDKAGVTSILNALLANNIAPTRASLNVLLLVVADRGDVSSCQQVFAQIKRLFGSANVFGYNCLLECMGKRGNATECNELLKEMRRTGIEPDTSTLNTIFKYFPEPCELHTMVSHIKRDTRTYNTLLNNAVNQHDAATALNLLRVMKDSHMVPDATTYSTVLKAIIHFKEKPAVAAGGACVVGSVAGSGSGDSAAVASSAQVSVAGSLVEPVLQSLNIALEWMRASGVRPDIVSYQRLISAAADAGYAFFFKRFDVLTLF